MAALCVFVKKDIPVDYVKLIHVIVLLVRMEEQKMYQDQPVYVHVEVVSLGHYVK